MNNCQECNRPINSINGLICTTCNVPFCLDDIRYHYCHTFQTFHSITQYGEDDITSKVSEAISCMQELKSKTGIVVDFLRNFENEVSKHEFLLFSVKEKISKYQQSHKPDIEAFKEKHNLIIKSIINSLEQNFKQIQEMYTLWGKIGNYKYEDLFKANSNSINSSNANDSINMNNVNNSNNINNSNNGINLSPLSPYYQMKQKYNTDNKLSISEVIKETSYQNNDINQKQKNTGKRVFMSNDHDIFVILN